ncbi:C-type lectin 37Db-like [Anopheles ziemanni]|uniref:C-type lectin 37Db-like n=1 Tax=Anopheles coustani TaxID=139045 RepID=UPI00265AAFD1|nr:C-type lectin 37Db-like [Anopheles coustani]XP_058178771.1 C-type lectin 37Db-like [Anopheles ziemanni]
MFISKRTVSIQYLCSNGEDMTKLNVLMVICFVMAFQGQVLLQQTDQAFAFSRQKQYYFSNSFKLNWFKAVEYCRDRGMFLLSVQDAEERQGVINYLTSTGYTRTHKELRVWISANDLGEEGEFHWASTGGRVNYPNWSDTEPNDFKTDDCTGEDCVALEYDAEGGSNFNYTFNDLACTKEFLFICETLPQ